MIIFFQNADFKQQQSKLLFKGTQFLQVSISCECREARFAKNIVGGYFGLLTNYGSHKPQFPIWKQKRKLWLVRDEKQRILIAGERGGKRRGKLEAWGFVQHVLIMVCCDIWTRLLPIVRTALNQAPSMWKKESEEHRPDFIVSN